MDSIAALQPGMELNNDELTTLFKCSPQAGMRRSIETNTLVIVANHVKSVYGDRWEGGTFHYTGMGLTGDQSLDKSQNKTLAESGSNGVAVHLFEVHKAKIYSYVGEVELVAPPYQEQQYDEKSNPRKVWVFPLKPKTGIVPTVAIEIVRDLDQHKAKVARALSDEEVAVRARRTGRTKVGVRAATVQQYQRSSFVAENAKRRANGICELCKQPAPFRDKTGRPYLETHHVVWLARGGADSIENTVALCPNCHKKMHVVDAVEDVMVLQNHLLVATVQ